MVEWLPRVTGLLESALYVADIELSLDFYERTLGLERLVVEDNFAALSVCGKQVLLIFERGAAAEATTSEGGIIPAHDASGRMHLAFSVEVEQLASWEERLRELGISIESTVRWPRGGRSLYLRDPDGHLVELATPGIWEIY